MDLDLLGSLGWREGLMAIIGLLVFYIVVLYLRLRRLQNGVAALPPLAARSAVAAYSAIQEEDLAPAVAPAVQTQTDAAKPAFAWNEPPQENPGQAEIDGLQRQVHQLRSDLDELRGEVQAVRDDFRQQAVQTTGSPQTPSPLYNDAMQLAIQGHDASTIARHCGIARAEADLVVALARSRREGF